VNVAKIRCFWVPI